jgi:hypothetical protein
MVLALRNRASGEIRSSAAAIVHSDLLPLIGAKAADALWQAGYLDDTGAFIIGRGITIQKAKA